MSTTGSSGDQIPPDEIATASTQAPTDEAPAPTDPQSAKEPTSSALPQETELHVEGAASSGQVRFDVLRATCDRLMGEKRQRTRSYSGEWRLTRWALDLRVAVDAQTLYEAARRAIDAGELKAEPVDDFREFTVEPQDLEAWAQRAGFLGNYWEPLYTDSGPIVARCSPEPQPVTEPRDEGVASSGQRVSAQAANEQAAAPTDAQPDEGARATEDKRRNGAALVGRNGDPAAVIEQAERALGSPLREEQKQKIWAHTVAEVLWQTAEYRKLPKPDMAEMIASKWNSLPDLVPGFAKRFPRFDLAPPMDVYAETIAEWIKDVNPRRGVRGRPPRGRE